MKKVKNKTKFRVRLLPLVGCLFAMLVVTSVFVSISSASKGSELMEIEREMQDMSARNQQLKMEMISGTSLKYIAERADELGMVRPEKIMYLNQETMKSSSLARAE
jgi:cell division protein FtsL